MRFFLAQHLSESWKEYIKYHSEILTFNAGDKIFRQNEPVKGLYFINSGKVKVVKEKNNQIFIFRFASDNDVLGHRGLDEENCYCISAICYSDTEVTFIPINILTHVLKVNAEFTYQFLLFFCVRITPFGRPNFKPTGTGKNCRGTFIKL
jgi:CRP/FNR family transcriptional regulator